MQNCHSTAALPVNGEMDEYPEQAFLNAGTIDEVIEKGKKMLAEVKK